MTSHLCQRVNTGESYIFYFGIFINMLWAFNSGCEMHPTANGAIFSLEGKPVHMPSDSIDLGEGDRYTPLILAPRQLPHPSRPKSS